LTEQAIETVPALRAWTRLLRAHARTTRTLNAQLLEEHELTINDFEALYVLAHAEEGRLKRIELARRLLLTPSGITRLLAGLEHAGLVERASCASDLRVTYAQLTDAGRERLDAAWCSHMNAVQSLLEEHLSEDELDSLSAALGKLPGVLEGSDACAVD
jgi:DNA-binding MarR family transcriptional regulator